MICDRERCLDSTSGAFRNFGQRVLWQSAFRAVSSDGQAFDTVAQVANDVSPRLADILIKEFAGRLEARQARYVHVLARSIGPVPDWHFAAGGKGWLFVDEIVVE